GETTPHFFTGDTRLSGFQRLPEPVQHPLQSTAVSAAPFPNVVQQPVERTRPELMPSVVSAVSTVQVGLTPAAQPQPQVPDVPSPVASPGKPVNWGQEQRLDTHFFPKHSPIQI